MRFHINEKLSTWLETNDWWKKLDQLDQLNQLNQGEVCESVSKYWLVEAAPIGALSTFEITFNEESNTWRITPSSRVKLNE